MDVIIDTDIISTFGKIKKYELLLMLFSNSKLFISSSVYHDLIIAKELGYDFVNYILNYKPNIENYCFNIPIGSFLCFFDSLCVRCGA